VTTEKKSQAPFPRVAMTPVAEALHPARQDFRKFIYMLWKHLNLPSPTEIQYDIASYLQKGPRRLIIEAFRGVGKSWLTAGFVVWLLWNDPQNKVLVVSASKDRADQFSTFVKRIIAEMPCVMHLKPSGDQRDSMLAFDVGPALADHSPSVKSVGLYGQLTGSRANVIVADDVEVPNNALTQMMRDRLSERVKEFDAILKPGGRVIYLGTPQTEMSLYNDLPERGYEVRVWPALYPTLKEITAYKGRLAPYITKKLEKNPDLAGRTTDPMRFSDEDLMERRVSYGRGGFALQFMLDTSLADADKYPLKLADMIVMSCSPDIAPLKVAWASSPELCWSELPTTGLSGDRYYRPFWKSQEVGAYSGCVMAIDPSGRGKDETGYAVVKNLHGNLYLVAAGGLKGGYDETVLETLARIAKAHGVKLIIVEPNFGDGMFNQLLKPVLGRIYPCTVEDAERSSTQKEARIIDTLEPVLASHRLVVDPKVIEEDYRTSVDDPKYGLFFQLTRLTRDRNSLAKDDRLDAVALAVGYWVEAMAKDQSKVIQAHKDEQLKQGLKEFMQGVLGKSLWKPKGGRGSFMGGNRAMRR
jgi:Holliday junction resolvasome RuvABC endonuclease subunit